MSVRARAVALTAAGMLILQLAWILTIAPFHGIDEIDHAYRASMVGQGHWRGDGEQVDSTLGRGELVPVRPDLVDAARRSCQLVTYYGPANCSPVSTASDPGEVLVASSAARYNPTFYAVVGTVGARFHGVASLYAMRVTAALMCTAMFAAGLWSLLTFTRRRWLPATLFLAATPVTLYSTAIAAPNGLEMVSGLSLWCSLLALYASPVSVPRGTRRGLQVVAAFSGATLVTVHTLGSLWLLLIVLVAMIIAGPRRVLAKVRAEDRGHYVLVAVCGLATLASIGWVVASGTNDPAQEATHVPGSAFPGVLSGIILWPLQAIAAYPTRNEPAPVVVYAMALALMAVPLLLAWHRLRGRALGAVTAVVLLSFATPLVLSVLTYHQVGLAWQGRYQVPFSCGFFLLLGFALERAPSPPQLSRRMLVLGGVLLSLELVISQRHVVATEVTLHLNRSYWHAPSTPLLTGLVVLGVGLWLLALTLRKPDGHDQEDVPVAVSLSTT